MMESVQSIEVSVECQSVKADISEHDSKHVKEKEVFCESSKGNEKDQNDDEKTVKPAFKMPMIISSNKIKTKSAFEVEPKVKTVKIKSQKVASNKIVQEVETQKPISQPISLVHNKPPEPKTPKELPFSYQEPKWSGKPDKEYSFEVIKGGKIVANIDLTKESFYVFGRLESCHISFEHPSVSRYHAILQYRTESDEEHESGFYIYDLESTHGTFLNKNQIRPRTYYRVRVGHMIKLGGSTRLHILQGPEEDEEKESELTVTEIKALAMKKKLEALKSKEEGRTDDSETQKDKDAGIDWGFGEDAVEDQIGDNPFSIMAEIAPNEEIYFEDPKKTLRGWFEREGYELEYKVEEKGVAHFTCRIELPIDVAYCQAYFAEATVKGKKKEAVVAAALEACRILDRHGLLRQSQHESRKRKKKNWEDEDFYDSDEDTFLDRTGTIEKKRELRKKMVTNEVETYDSLSQKLTDLEKEMEDITNQLQQSAAKVSKPNIEDQTEDSLEAYMAAISKSNEVDKTKKSRLKLQLSSLQKEKFKLEKLINLAKPTSLPPLTQVKEGKNKFLPMIGSMKGFKLKASLNKSKPKVVKPLEKLVNQSEEFVEEEDEDENNEIKDEDENNEIKDAVIEKAKDMKEEIQNDSKNMNENKDSEKEQVDDIRKEDSNDKDFGENLMILPEESVIPKVIGPLIPKDVEIPTTNEAESENQVNSNPLNRKRNTERMERRKRAKKDATGYDPSDPDYAVWLPPENQTGDGKTHLNDKYGY